MLTSMALELGEVEAGSADAGDVGVCDEAAGRLAEGDEEGGVGGCWGCGMGELAACVFCAEVRCAS